MTTSKLPPRMLEKVRALLAQAESTTFEAEAEAFTAKAQELMARYRIDQAVLAEQDDGSAGGPTSQRVTIARPYAKEKAFLLMGIADANGCRAVWASTGGYATVVGFASDLPVVDELFTSLLVQASRAIQREGSKRDAWGRNRTVRFRRTFLIAFSVRISERLQEAVHDVAEETEDKTGTAVVPLLAAREEAARAAAAEMFPDTRALAPSATDREGWVAGQRFADQASLA